MVQSWLSVGVSLGSKALLRVGWLALDRILEWVSGWFQAGLGLVAWFRAGFRIRSDSLSLGVGLLSLGSKKPDAFGAPGRCSSKGTRWGRQLWISLHSSGGSLRPQSKPPAVRLLRETSLVVFLLFGVCCGGGTKKNEGGGGGPMFLDWYQQFKGGLCFEAAVLGMSCFELNYYSGVLFAFEGTSKGKPAILEGVGTKHTTL